MPPEVTNPEPVAGPSHSASTDPQADAVEDLQPRHRLRLIVSSGKNSAKSKGKAGKKQVGKPRGVGKLKEFVDLPLDVIYETACFLEPKDLLNLSRVTKRFRSVFLSRAARSVWCRVLSKFPTLPACPDDLVEPQYASFMFENSCMGCDTTRSEHAYSLRLRLCKSCEKANIVSGRALKRIHKYSADIVDIVYPLIPAHNILSGRLGMSTSRPHNYDNNMFFKPEFEHMLETYLKLVRIKREEDVEAFCEKRRALAMKMMEHGRELEVWHRISMQEKEQHRSEAGSRRYNTMCKRMDEMGWEPRYFPALRDHDVWSKWTEYMHQSREFNERGFKMILPKLENIYNIVKARRLKEAHELLIRMRYDTVVRGLSEDEKDAMPAWSDAMRLPCIDAFLRDREGYQDSDELWGSLTPQILAEAQPFKGRLREYLADKMRCADPSIPPDMPARDVLHRASALFSCSRSGCFAFGMQAHGYPGILEHYTDDNASYLSSTSACGFFAPGRMIMSACAPEMVRTAKGVLSALGLPGDAPREAVGVGKRLFCKCGHYKCEKRLTFEDVVRHVAYEQNWYKDYSDKVLEEWEEADIIRNDHDEALLPQLLELVDPESDKYTVPVTKSEKHQGNIDVKDLFCELCYQATHKYNYMSNREAEYHMKAKHGKDYEDGDFQPGFLLTSLHGGEEPYDPYFDDNWW